MAVRLDSGSGGDASDPAGSSSASEATPTSAETTGGTSIAGAGEPARLTAEAIARALSKRPAVASEAPGPTKAAVAVVLHDGPRGTRVLLIQRADRVGDPWSGHIGLPGGRWDSGDPDLVATAIREANEEVGMDLSARARIVGPLPSVVATGRGARGPLTIAPFVFVVTDPSARPASAEVAEAFWVDLAVLASGKVDGETRYEIDGRTVRLPAWHVSGKVIWGLTRQALDALVVAAKWVIAAELAPPTPRD